MARNGTERSGGDDWRAASRGTYRVLYRIYDHAHEVVVLRIEHRRDVDQSR